MYTKNQFFLLVRIIFITVFTVCFIFALSPAQAYVIYTDRDAWEVDVTGLITTETFDNDITNADSIILENGIVSTINPGLLTNGLNFVGNGQYNGRIGEISNLHPEFTTWTLTDATNGFFADFSALNTYGLTVVGDFDGTGTETTISIADTIGSSGGFGIIGLGSFTSFAWDTNDASEYFYIDNFSTASSAPVPEPATMLLLGSGLAGLAGFRRKFKKS